MTSVLIDDARWQECKYDLRRLSAVGCAPLMPDDGRSVQQMFERDPEFFEAVTGLPLGPAEAQSLYVGLPEGKGYDEKVLLGIFGDAPPLQGVVDLMANYPAEWVWTLGLLFIDPRCRRRGIGKRVLEALCESIEEIGARSVRAVVASNDDRATAFLASAGFSPATPASGQSGEATWVRPLSSSRER